MYHLLGMTMMLVAFYVAARLLVPIAREPGFGSAAWHIPVLGAALMGSFVVGLLIFELVSGRALDGFSVIRRKDAPRAFWGWIAFHFSFFLIIAAATWTYFFAR